MTSSTSRALELLELLQSGGVRTVADLAERLAVDERTVRRHVERLREMGIPVDALRGRHGGYRIGSGYRMPPLMLRDDEAVAVLEALLAAAPTGSSGVATATAKLLRALPQDLARRAEALLATAHIAGRPAEPPADPTIVLGAAEAIRDRRPIALTYRSGGDRVTRRTVQPHDLVAHRGRWYLVGLDSIARERRTFRLDRVASLRALPGSVPPPAAHDAVEDLVDGFARADYRFTVRLRVNAAVDHVRRHLPAGVAAVGPIDPPPVGDGAWTGVEIHAQALDWLPPVLLAIGCPIAIEEPDELRALLRREAGRLAAMAVTDAPRAR